MKFAIFCPFRLNPSGVFAPAVDEYCNRLRRSHQVELVTLSRAGRAPRQGRMNQDDTQNFYERHKSSLEAGLVIALDERGEALDTASFADLIGAEKESRNRVVSFCLGSAYGLPANLASVPRVRSIRLSGLTLCHELALVVLAEQIYRATALLSGHPYHHAGESPFIRELNRKTKRQKS